MTEPAWRVPLVTRTVATFLPISVVPERVLTLGLYRPSTRERIPGPDHPDGLANLGLLLSLIESRLGCPDPSLPILKP
jgi:hypothetical protein